MSRNLNDGITVQNVKDFCTAYKASRMRHIVIEYSSHVTLEAALRATADVEIEIDTIMDTFSIGATERTNN